MRATQRVRIGDVVDVIGGATPTTSNAAYWGGDIPWVSPKDMKAEAIISAIDTVTSEGISAARLRIIPENSILIVTRGMILAHSVPVAITRRPVTINQDMKALLPKRGTNPEFLLRMLQGAKTNLLSFISTAAHGTKKFDLEQLLNYTIPYGDADYQRRIVDILNHAVSIRRLRDKARAKLRKIVPALFVDMFGDPATNPKRWEMTTIGAVTNYTRYGPRFPDRPYSEMGAHILRTTDMGVDGSLRWWESPILSVTDEEKEKYCLAPNTLLVTRSGAIGKTALFKGAEQPCIAGAYLIEFALSNSVTGDYVLHLLLSHYGQSQLLRGSRTVAQPNINAPAICAIPLPLPPISFQRKFAARVAEIKGAASLNDKAVSSAERLTQSLLAQVFGQAGLQTTIDETAIEVLA